MSIWKARVIQVARVTARDEVSVIQVETDRTDAPDNCFYLELGQPMPAFGDTVSVGHHWVTWGTPAIQARKHWDDFPS